MRSTLVHLARISAFAAALVLVGLGASAVSSGAAHAQSLNTGTAHISAFTVDGVGLASGCADSDSWCAYCDANPASTLCDQLQPTMAKGDSLTPGANNSNNTPVLGVEAGLPAIAVAMTSPMLLSTGGAAAGSASMGAISSGLASPIGVSWQWCSIVGGGSLWVPAGTTSPSLSC